MTTVDAESIAAHFPAYLKKVAAGESFLIAIRDRAVAELHPAEKSVATSRPFGLCAGEFVVPDDFDAPLPKHIVADFEPA